MYVSTCTYMQRQSFTRQCLVLLQAVHMGTFYLILSCFIFKGVGCDLINCFCDSHVGCNPPVWRTLPCTICSPPPAISLPPLLFLHLASLLGLCIYCMLSLYHLLTAFFYILGFLFKCSPEISSYSNRPTLGSSPSVLSCFVFLYGNVHHLTYTVCLLSAFSAPWRRWLFCLLEYPSIQTRSSVNICWINEQTWPVTFLRIFVMALYDEWLVESFLHYLEILSPHQWPGSSSGHWG